MDWVSALLTKIVDDLDLKGMRRFHVLIANRSDLYRCLEMLDTCNNADADVATLEKAEKLRKVCKDTLSSTEDELYSYYASEMKALEENGKKTK